MIKKIKGLKFALYPSILFVDTQTLGRDDKCLLNRFKRASQKLLYFNEGVVFVVFKNNVSKKNAAKKHQKKNLTNKFQICIFGVLFINLNSIKRAFFTLERVPKSRAKGTNIQGIEAKPLLYNLKKLYFNLFFNRFLMPDFVFLANFCDYFVNKKGTKIQGRVPKSRAKGTNIQGRSNIEGWV
jgi:hypothetical protein